MSKLTKDEKIERRDLLGVLSQIGGEVFSNPSQGVTVVVVPAVQWSLLVFDDTVDSSSTNDRFVRVAVAVCSESDTFKRKRGELIALQRLMNGETIPVRRNGCTLDEIAEAIADTVA